MIRPLRQHHRRLIIALGAVLPVAFAVGIAARKPLPEVYLLPKEFSPVSTVYVAEAWSRADLFPKSPVQVRLLREFTGAGKFAMAFSAAIDFVKPDLLVYWSDGNPNGTNALPANAILLGAFNSPSLPLPAAAEKNSGTLLLYSLADNEIVDESKPIRFDNSMK